MRNQIFISAILLSFMAKSEEHTTLPPTSLSPLTEVKNSEKWPIPYKWQIHKVSFESFIEAIEQKKINCKILDAFTQKDYVFFRQSERRSKHPKLSDLDFYDTSLFPQADPCFISMIIRLLPCADGASLEVMSEILSNYFIKNSTTFYSLLDQENRNQEQQKNKIDSWACVGKNSFLKTFEDKAPEIDNSLVTLDETELNEFIKKSKNYRILNLFNVSLRDYIDHLLEVAEKMKTRK